MALWMRNERVASGLRRRARDPEILFAVNPLDLFFPPFARVSSLVLNAEAEPPDLSQFGLQR
jgi:hypothetical protein